MMETIDDDCDNMDVVFVAVKVIQRHNQSQILNVQFPGQDFGCKVQH